MRQAHSCWQTFIKGAVKPCDPGSDQPPHANR